MPPVAVPNDAATEPRLVLASGSPRRRYLLHRAGFAFELSATPAMEEVESDELSATELSLLNALRKARAAAGRRGHMHSEVVLGADTLVTLDNQIFGKPRDRRAAAGMLRLLQGRTHSVLTGVALVRGTACELFAVSTDVTFRRLDARAIDAYLALIDPLDKAGGYAAQEQGDRIIAAVAGSWTNVMGLPMEAVTNALARHGISAHRRRHVGSGSPWESVVGYTRAVRVGRIVHVAGTTATDAQGRVIAPDDPAGQTRFILEKIGHALEQAGASLRDVVRTRMFVTDISRWEAIGRVHGEFFKDVRPAATMVEVARLIEPGLLVEIEAEAIVGDDLA